MEVGILVKVSQFSQELPKIGKLKKKYSKHKLCKSVIRTRNDTLFLTVYAKSLRCLHKGFCKSPTHKLAAHFSTVYSRNTSVLAALNASIVLAGRINFTTT